MITKFKFASLFLLASFFSAACTSTQPTKKPIAQIVTKDPKKFMNQENCVVLSKGEITPPYYLQDHGLIITGILKPCVTLDGKRGVEKKTPWMAMGFPCTGGGGKVSWKGKYVSPKMVTFEVSNSCPMKPSAREQVMTIGQSVLGLPPESKLLAYYPFALQYWELVDYPDADTSSTVDLISGVSRQESWQKLRDKSEPLKAKFYGRENAWVRGNFIYYAEVEIVLSSDDKFQVILLEVKSLSQEEILEVKKRCERLRPMRNCSSVFSL